jgi:hypothetical protein
LVGENIHIDIAVWNNGTNTADAFNVVPLTDDEPVADLLPALKGVGSL